MPEKNQPPGKRSKPSRSRGILGVITVTTNEPEQFLPDLVDALLADAPIEDKKATIAAIVDKTLTFKGLLAPAAERLDGKIAAVITDAVIDGVAIGKKKILLRIEEKIIAVIDRRTEAGDTSEEVAEQLIDLLQAVISEQAAAPADG